DFRLSLLSALDVDVVVIGDQPRRTADLGHDGVAGVDAQAALDAIHLRAVADVDPSWADRNALITIDAVADGLALGAQFLRLFQRGAFLTAVVAIGDVERPFIGQRRLDARPRAHVDADLLAHPPRKHVGGRGQDADPDIGNHRRPEGDELLHQ